MADRNQILAEFQAFTDIENVEECIVILEQHNWELMPAVQSAMSHTFDPPDIETCNPAQEDPPPSYAEFTDEVGVNLHRHVTFHQNYSDLFKASPSNTQSLGAAAAAAEGAASSLSVSSVGFRPLEGSLAGGMSVGVSAMPGMASMSSSSASTSSSTAASIFNNRSPPKRLIHFNVEYRDRNIQLNVHDNEKIAKIKELLSTELGIPAGKQVLSGWGNRATGDHYILRDLNLPKENKLFLLVPDLPSPTQALNHKEVAGEESSDIVERLSQTFTLNIRYTDKDKTYRLNFPGSKTIQEVKGDVFTLIDVPVRYQVWSGWPSAAKDESMTLAGCGVGYPCHHLEISSSKPDTRKHVYNTEEVLHEMEISDEEFEDAHETFNIDDDEMFPDDIGISQSRHNLLMPDNVADQTQALEHFSHEFGARYGECHPVFYIGTLDDAIRDALLVPAKERKLLAIYLHHDSSILSNVFCAQILCAESVVAYLSSNFLTWAWDMTCESNKNRLLTMCTHHFGSVAASTVRNFSPDQLPLLLVITRNRGTNEVFSVIRGNTTVDELMGSLIQSVDVFTEQQKSEILEEEERKFRENIKNEQDAAYQMSLAADRAKEEAKRAEEEERRKAEMEEEKRKLEERQQREQEEATKEAIRQSLAELVPEEPPADCNEPVSNIRIRTPGGTSMSRKFLASHSLQVLLNFISSKGFHTDTYKVLTTYPRRDLTSLDTSKSLEELKLYPQETVMVEER